MHLSLKVTGRKINDKNAIILTKFQNMIYYNASKRIALFYIIYQYIFLTSPVINKSNNISTVERLIWSEQKLFAILSYIWFLYAIFGINQFFY